MDYTCSPPSWFTALGKHLYEPSQITPILLVNGTILGLVAVRNWQMADRARSNVIERLEKAPNYKCLDQKDIDDRIRNLIRQNEAFLRRYVITSYACTLVFCSLILFGSTLMVNRPDCDSNFYAGIIASLAAGLVLVGFLMTVVELKFGAKTLELNNEAMNYQQHKK